MPKLSQDYIDNAAHDAVCEQEHLRALIRTVIDGATEAITNSDVAENYSAEDMTWFQQVLHETLCELLDSDISARDSQLEDVGIPDGQVDFSYEATMRGRAA